MSTPATIPAKIVGVLVALAVLVAGAIITSSQREGPDRQAVYEACMAATPGSATSFDAISTCTDKANAAR